MFSNCYLFNITTKTLLVKLCNNIIPCSLVLASAFDHSIQKLLIHNLTSGMSGLCLLNVYMALCYTKWSQIWSFVQLNHLCSVLLRKYICSSCNIEQSSRQQMQMQSYRLVWEGKLIHLRGKKKSWMHCLDPDAIISSSQINFNLWFPLTLVNQFNWNPLRPILKI